MQQYFDYCGKIHKIFSTFKFKSYYDGKRTSRLLEQRWCGHLKVTEVVYDNYSTMIEALRSAMNQQFEELDDVTVVECVGLLTVMKSLSFRFVLRTMLKIFNTIEPADRILQHRDNGLATALPILQAVYSSLQEYRYSDEVYEEVMQDCRNLLPDETAGFDRVNNERGSKRKIKPNERFGDFIMTESSGIYQRNNEVDNNGEDECKRLYYEILDSVLELFDVRFFDNDELFNVIDKVYNFNFKSGDELDAFRNLHPNISKIIPTNEEITCVKNYFQENNVSQEDYFKMLYRMRNAFKRTYEIFATAATFACSSATCEATFSTRNRIVTPYRQSMLFERSCNLTVIPFEKKQLEKISIEKFLRTFNSRKNRRLQLF